MSSGVKATNILETRTLTYFQLLTHLSTWFVIRIMCQKSSLHVATFMSFILFQSTRYQNSS